MTINKINFRSTLVALTFGALVTVLPASADTISLSTSGLPTNILVGGFDWTFNQTTTPSTPLPGSGVFLSNIGSLSSIGNLTASATQSEVVDVTVKPTVNGGAAASVVFEGTIQEVGGVYSLVFGNNGTTACSNPGSSSCFTTTYGNVINNGQVAANGYTSLVSNGITYEVATSTTLSPTKPLNYFNGFVGVVGAPEPATYATTGLAAAFLGLFLRRKAKKS